MPKSPEEYAHQEWLGYVQPVGLAVSVPAMLEAQCYINKNITGEHARFLDCLPRDEKDQIVPEITDFGAFACKCLEWEAEDLIEIPQRVALSDEMSSLEVILPQYHETLRPTHVVWDWGTGGSATGDSGVGTGGSGQSPTPNPKPPNPHSCSFRRCQRILALMIPAKPTAAVTGTRLLS